MVGSLLITAATLALGQPAEPPDGLLVLGVAGHSDHSRAVTREWAAVADPRSGSIRKRRLSGGTLCHGPVLAVGDRVVFSGHRGRRSVARALPMSLRGPARSLGAADTFAASHGHDSVWLGRWRGRRSNARLGLHQVDARGRVLVGARILGSRWGLFHAALSRGFVLTIRDSLVIWDHFRDLPVLAIPRAWFLAASATRVAWCPAERCPAIQVWSRRGRRALRAPAGVHPKVSNGSFSPDGRLLATKVTTGGRARVAVVDLRSGAWTLVPGGRLGGYDALAWSPSGRWLLFGAGDEKLRAWRFGAPSAISLPIDPGGTVMSIAAAP